MRPRRGLRPTIATTMRAQTTTEHQPMSGRLRPPVAVGWPHGGMAVTDMTLRIRRRGVTESSDQPGADQEPAPETPKRATRPRRRRDHGKSRLGRLPLPSNPPLPAGPPSPTRRSRSCQSRSSRHRLPTHRRQPRPLRPRRRGAAGASTIANAVHRLLDPDSPRRHRGRGERGRLLGARDAARYRQVHGGGHARRGERRSQAGRRRSTGRPGARGAGSRHPGGGGARRRG